ncbi:unnamed protein product [Adineta steineri]|uniref:F-box domain-containing protein n=1 Tax=Adineta steineri TaxID=433720 RepID=A0A819N248_9BILA|nr:unnamed protein product [Adineta steineri]
MATGINSPIGTLPVEMLHRIFDNLDAETILLSIRVVSRLFQAAASTYNRYSIDFQLISTSKFPLLCRLINPENVISLTLLNNYRTFNQTDLFISLTHLKQFTRLHSLTLDINESQLNFVLERINLNTLTSLSFNIGIYDNRWTDTTLNFLSSALSQTTFRRLELYIRPETKSRISWPVNCTIRNLTINNGIYMDDLCKIFQNSPYLNTLIMNEFPKMMNKNLSLRFRQLTSLTFKDFCIVIDELESFLLLTPSLIQLKLIGGRGMLDGKKWEELIQRNLPQLNKFEFYFTQSISTMLSSTDPELIISSFQTSFWIEHKKWFVTCEYHFENSKSIHLYSLPICKPFLYYIPISKKISSSTYPLIMNNDLSMMDNIKLLELDWTESLTDDIQEKQKIITNQPLFSNVIEININSQRVWPLLSLQSLSIFIDISRIVQIKIYSMYFDEYDQNIWINIGNFMKQADNLSSFIIENNSHIYYSNPTMENIYSILPRHVRYLEIPIDHLNKIPMIFERCENLSTIRFHCDNTYFSRKVINWFDNNTTNTTCHLDDKIVCIWLGKKKHHLLERFTNHSIEQRPFKLINQFFKK